MIKRKFAFLKSGENKAALSEVEYFNMYMDSYNPDLGIAVRGVACLENGK
ncbi:hypothetical protein JW877_02795 [bacterium]|nr:hypothetical protein [bacterium]